VRVSDAMDIVSAGIRIVLVGMTVHLEGKAAAISDLSGRFAFPAADSSRRDRSRHGRDALLAQAERGVDRAPRVHRAGIW